LESLRGAEMNLAKLIVGICFAMFAFTLEANAQSYIEQAPWSPPENADQPAPSILTAIDKAEDNNREGATALNGTQYTVLTPIFLGTDNNFSFIRFPNGGETNADVRISVVGSPSAENYGTAFTSVAPLASPQFSMQQIFDAIGVERLQFGDDSLSLYLQSPQGGNFIGFQHVVWNSLTGFFENASICTYRFDVDYTALNRALVNVHTSNIPAYPGIVFLHNYASFPVTYQADVFDARDGVYLGSVNFNMTANNTLAVEFGAIEDTIGFQPSPNQYHANVIFTAQNTGGIHYGLPAQGINNLQLEAYTNMSVACGINAS
jgi:hypothetical protein